MAEEAKTTIADFQPGDTVKVSWEVTEGEKTRVQPFIGVVLAKKGKAGYKTFTVRRISSDGTGVERIFPLGSPHLKGLEVTRAGKVRRAKLYYLRAREGKLALKVPERTK